jgi:hypothetical protein
MVPVRKNRPECNMLQVRVQTVEVVRVMSYDYRLVGIHGSWATAHIQHR